MKKKPRVLYILEVNDVLDTDETYFDKDDAEACKEDYELIARSSEIIRVIKFQEVGHRAAHHKRKKSE